MKLKLYFYFLLVIFSAVSLACSTSKAAFENRAEVVFNDGYKNSSNGKVIIDDRNLNLKNQPVSTSVQNSEGITRTNADNSEVVIRYDGYGNKTETRMFKNHPRITTLLIRTSADGKQQFYVYGYSKEVKTLPKEMSGAALTAPADEIANAAGLYETRSNDEITNFRKKPNQLQPLPSYKFPIQMPQNVPSQPEEIDRNTAPLPEKNSPNSKESKDSVVEERKPDGEKQLLHY